MIEHRYANLQYGILHWAEYVCGGGRIRHRVALDTIYYDQIVWA